uniref:p12 structural protein n=1 Tax=Glypta fumiferanae TaxID=389681 RepID=A0A0F6Q8V2_9HYME|nr:P12 structural protein [Glypta fumiferanae]
MDSLASLPKMEFWSLANSFLSFGLTALTTYKVYKIEDKPPVITALPTHKEKIRQAKIVSVVSAALSVVNTAVSGYSLANARYNEDANQSDEFQDQDNTDPSSHFDRARLKID